MNDLYLCHACAGVCNVARVNTLNQHTLQFCPLCGARHTLERTRSSFDWHRARCFSGMPKHMLQMLSEAWGMNAFNEQQDYPVFVDYVRMRWAAFVNERSAKREGPC